MDGEASKRRIIVYPPGHPYLMTLYILVALLVALIASGSLADLIAGVGGYAHLLASYLVAYLIFLSPLLSFFNIVLTTIKAGYVEDVVELDYIYIFGIPVTIPRVRIVERRSILALNVGGGLVPIVVSIIILVVMVEKGGGAAITSTLIAIAATSLITFAASRSVPGVGIAVPALIPPLTSAISVWLLMGAGPLAALAAYVGGSMGSLVGADLLRFAKDIDKLRAPIISIGGAGVFDGVFLSGIIAAFLVY